MKLRFGEREARGAGTSSLRLRPQVARMQRQLYCNEEVSNTGTLCNLGDCLYRTVFSRRLLPNGRDPKWHTVSTHRAGAPGYRGCGRTFLPPRPPFLSMYLCAPGEDTVWLVPLSRSSFLTDYEMVCPELSSPVTPVAWSSWDKVPPGDLLAAGSAAEMSCGTSSGRRAETLPGHNGLVIVGVRRVPERAIVLGYASGGCG